MGRTHQVSLASPCKECGSEEGLQRAMLSGALSVICANCGQSQGMKKSPKVGEHDPVNHPTHYTSHPSGIECIEVTRHMGFNLGNAVKYAWRADLKGNAIQDLEKAEFYIKDEIKKRKKENESR